MLTEKLRRILHYPGIKYNHPTRLADSSKNNALPPGLSTFRGSFANIAEAASYMQMKFLKKKIRLNLIL